MSLIKPNDVGFNKDTVEWRGRKLTDLSKRELIDIIIKQFAVNVAMSEELKQTQRILEPSPLWTPYS